MSTLQAQSGNRARRPTLCAMLRLSPLLWAPAKGQVAVNFVGVTEMPGHWLFPGTGKLMPCAGHFMYGRWDMFRSVLSCEKGALPRSRLACRS